MNNQGAGQNATTQNHSAFAYLVAGLGIGAALSVFLAPKSGEETRNWLANKCLDAVDTANEKVRHSRAQVREVMDRGQQQVSDAVAAGREAIGEPKVASPS
jgi:gas vesicle protein